MKKLNKKENVTTGSAVKRKDLKKIIIPGAVAVAIIGTTGGIILGNIFRTNKINNQALENMNEQDMSTTIFCSGKNIVKTGKQKI